MKPTCRNRCPGPLVRRRITQAYERKGSAVQVIIKNIPVTACSICGEETMPLATFGKINEILLPFHGKHNHVPKLPAAEVIIDFAAATRTLAKNKA